MTGSSQVKASGSINGFKDPRLNVDVKADAALADLGVPLRLPKPHAGRVKFEGKLSYDARELLLITGRARGADLALHEGSVRVDHIAVQSDVRMTNATVELRGTNVEALGGSFRGEATITEWKHVHAKGLVDGISLATANQFTGPQKMPYTGRISGPVEVTGTGGLRNWKAGGNLNITPAGGGVPVSGNVEVAYDQSQDSIQLGRVATDASVQSSRCQRNAGRLIEGSLESPQFGRSGSALSMTGSGPDKLPLTLNERGTAVFTGEVNGPIKAARVAGSLVLTEFEVQKQKVDRLVASIDVTSAGAQVSSFALGQESLRLEGSASADLHDWKLADTAAIKANVKLQGANVEKLLATAGQKLPVAGG